MLTSLKTQAILALVLLIAMLSSQAFMYTEYLSEVGDDFVITQNTLEKVNLVRNLENGVLDLQRNVLIFKQTASPSIIKKFDSIMSSVSANLNKLESKADDPNLPKEYLEIIIRMKSHLRHYQESFETVVEDRVIRQRLLNEDLLANFSRAQRRITTLIKESTETDEHIDFVEFSRHLAQTKSFMYSYLIEPNDEDIAFFKAQISAAKLDLKQSPVLRKHMSAFDNELADIENSFFRINQMTRGYLYLVNVVMAGSANEFFFLANELNRIVTDQEQDVVNQVFTELQKAKTQTYYSLLVMVALSVIAAIFFIYRSMSPINNLTHLFTRLARGEKITKIYHTKRKDEIGELARAAQVFHDRNLQRDILNIQLEEAKHNAEKATQLKSLFLANMSHEIRTPINGIVGLIDIVLKTDLTNKQREWLNGVVASSQLLMSIINDILDFSKIEAGKLNIENALFSPQSMFENVIINTASKAQIKNLDFLFHVNPSLPNNLYGDSLRISQILLNLCSNAVKFTETGKVCLYVEFEQRQTDANEIDLILKVRDTGIGMSPQQLSDVFNAFTQADGSTSRHFGGTGLGLSIVKQLTELMNGSVTATSTINEGSEFTINIPLREQAGSLPILCADKRYVNRIYYYSSVQQPLLASEYLSVIDPQYTIVTSDTVVEIIATLSTDDVLLIDVESMDAYQSIHKAITRAVEKKIGLGFITNLQPTTLPNILKKKWALPVLSHPFTPIRLINFIANVSGSEIDNELQLSKQKRQPQLTLEGHVLLVEDNSINQTVAVEMLKNLGVTFDIAEDGAQAVTRINNSPHYDIVLMDIQMPNMDGLEATKLIRLKGHHTLTICGLSANAMKEDIANAKKAGMDDYLTKPLKINALSTLLAKYLSSVEKPVDD